MKILVIGAESVILNLSVTPLLRKWSDDTNNCIDLLVNSRYAHLFAMNPDLNKIIRLTCPSGDGWTHRFIYSIRRYRRMLTLHKDNYDSIFFIEPLNPVQVLACKIYSGITRVVTSASDNNIEIALQEKGDELHFLPSSFTRPRNNTLKLYPDIQRVTELGRRFFLSLKGISFGIIMNSVSELDWPPSTWGRLIQELAKQGRVFLIVDADRMEAGSEDLVILANVGALCSDNLMTPVITDTPADFIAMISLCSCLISTDGDATWLAAALRVPVIHPASTRKSHLPPRGCTVVDGINAEEILAAVAHTLH